MWTILAKMWLCLAPLRHLQTESEPNMAHLLNVDVDQMLTKHMCATSSFLHKQLETGKTNGCHSLRQWQNILIDSSQQIFLNCIEKQKIPPIAKSTEGGANATILAAVPKPKK